MISTSLNTKEIAGA